MLGNWNKYFMVNEYRFFYNFVDKKPKYLASEEFKIFKLLIVSLFSVIGLFFALSNFCSVFFFILFELSIIHLAYFDENSLLGLFLIFFISSLWVYVCVVFSVFANGFTHLSFIVPLSLVSASKSKQNYIQIKKRITYCNAHLFLIFEVLLFLFIYFSDYSMGARFIIFDSLTACLLVGLQVLKTERYFEFYFFAIFTYSLEFIFWLVIYFEFNNLSALLIMLLQVFNLIFISANYIFSLKESFKEKLIKQNA